MSRHQLEVLLTEAQAGMVLADDLLDQEGQMLLPRGTALTEAMITSLAKRSVETLVIAGADRSAQEEQLEHEHLIKRVLHLFRHIRSEDLADQAMFELVLKFRREDQP